MRPILLRIRDGGKAGRREAGLKSNNSLSAGQSQSLLGSRCGSTAIHRRYPAPPCAEAARIQRRIRSGATPFGRAFDRRGRPASAAISQKTEVSQANQANRVREFPAEGRVWREAASSGRTRGGRSWDEPKLGRDETFRSQSHRVTAVRFGRKNVVSHHAANAIHQRGEIKSTPPRNLQSPTWRFPFDSARKHRGKRYGVRPARLSHLWSHGV